jgi:hypothetical protein
MKLSSALFLLVSLGGFLAGAEPNKVLLQVKFDNQPVGLYNKAMLDDDWRSPRWSRGVDDGRVSVKADKGGNHFLRVVYPTGAVGMRLGGAGWRTAVEAQDALWMSYKIRFKPGYHFVRGGKLPGLGGGKSNTGGHRPNGRDGCSVRFMWRENGKLSAYVYHPNQPTKYGEHFMASKPMVAGKWLTLKMRVKLNTPGKHDGCVLGWLDGEQVITVKNLRFRDIKSIKLDKVLFETFFGGSGPAYRPDRDQFIDFDEFRVWVGDN